MNPHRTVLVVDDDDDIRALICALLTRAGYRCVSVAGCDDFMPKPFRARDLLARLDQLMLVAA